MRGGWTAACAAMLMALAPGTSKSAQAEEFAPDLHGSAALYDTLDKAKKSQQQMALRLNSLYGFAEEDARWRDAGAFWAFSNARQIDFGERREALKERSGESDLAFDIQVLGISGRPRFPNPGSAEAGFPQGAVLHNTQAPPASATPPYGHRISTCDREHGFWPVFYFGATDHLQCVAHYWTLGALRPDLQSETTPRVRHAAQAYARETPTATEAGIREDVLPRVQARGQRIQTGEENPAALVADARACDARYGLEPLES